MVFEAFSKTGDRDNAVIRVVLEVVLCSFVTDLLYPLETGSMACLHITVRESRKSGGHN